MHTLIVSGGAFNINWFQDYLENHTFDQIIAVDKGIEIFETLDIFPNHLVGDLDSVNPIILNKLKKNDSIIIHSYPPQKDETDTEIALKLALQENTTKITIVGGLGKRFDHSLANLHILTLCLDKNVPCELLDPNNRIYLIQNSVSLSINKLYGKYISLIPLTSHVEGLTLKGFRYPLEQYKLSIGTSLGISNELIEEIGCIHLEDGILIVIESKD